MSFNCVIAGPRCIHDMQENLINGGNNTQNNYFLNITLKEQLETLQRLGLPAPIIESRSRRGLW